MKKDITALFCFVDDFCKIVDHWISKQLLSQQPHRKPTRTPEMAISEIMSIILLYQQSPCKNFKYFYESYVPLYRQDFPSLVSYNRFLELKPRALYYLACLVEWYCKQGRRTGISYIDSTPIAVCHNKRISRNKLWKGVAKIGKTTKGWFLGLKLHIVINENGELQGVRLSRGNVDDRAVVPHLTSRLTGLLFGDKGYSVLQLSST